MRARRLLTWTLTGSLSAACLWVAGDRIAHGDTFQVQEVRFVGNSRAGDVHLKHLADIRLGTHLFQADLDRAINGVTAHPWVDSASARRRFPGAIEIQIEEHHPRMLLALENLWFVDERGDIFKRADTESLDYPAITGIEPTLFDEHPSIARAIVSEAITLFDAISTDEELSSTELSEIHFDDQTGFELVLRSGTRVIVGFSDPAPALDRLSRMRAHGLDLSSPQRIDLDVGSVAIATPLH